MTIPRSLASLSADLLARKGGAKPAMRRQPICGGGESGDAGADDLGWNDWGHGPAEQPATPAPALDTPDVPEVLRRIEELGRRIAAAPATAPASRPAGRRAAFTLRLDSDRHLRLRMTSTMLDRSAQDIVTEALDLYISQLPEIASLADLARKHR
ncbi:hypothetical protein [Novosphingobium colocasiae]|uniref:hypothetical protein n=1 Tax=Novosphingobium colocasiae TaxID=1256513 RepID=UPI0035B44E36